VAAPSVPALPVSVGAEQESGEELKSLLKQKVQLAFGFALLTLLLVGTASYYWISVSDESTRWVWHTHEVLSHIQDLLLSMESIDTGSREYVLTGKESSLQPYYVSIQKIEEDQEAIRSLTLDNAVQQRQLPALAKLAAESIQRTGRIIALRRNQGPEAATAALASGPDQQVKAEFQEAAGKLQSEELRLRELRSTKAQRYSSESKIFLIVGTLFGILAVAAAGWSTARDTAKREVAEQKYRGLLEAAPDGMVVVNQGGEIVLLNAQAEKHFGYRRDELLGQKVKRIIPEGFAERLIADGTRTAAEALEQQIGTGIELYGQRKDGSQFPIEMMLSPLESPEGMLVTAAIRDITTRREAEALLALKVEELNRSNVELEQFAYVASHDLQEPLRMVASYTQLLSKRYKGRLDSDADDFIAFAVDGASRMQHLIQDLLVYSRVGKRGGELVDVSSEDALQQAVLNLRGAIEESGALVTHDPLPRVMADDIQLTQLLQNLVGNAIKYQRPGVPLVHISAAQEDGGMWQFSIQDNGLGIDPQFFEKIFGMFQRLHKREEFAGTGMGLAICKKIVERHGGKIWVESQPGFGSNFRFTLAAS
jgi:PAS domain S-box-containing protein